MRFVELRTRLVLRTIGPLPAIALAAWLMLVVLGGPANATASDLKTAGSLSIGLLPIAIVVATVSPYSAHAAMYLSAIAALTVFLAHAALGMVICWLLSLFTWDANAHALPLLAAALLFCPPITLVCGLIHAGCRRGKLFAALLAFPLQWLLFAPSMDWHLGDWLTLLLELACASILISLFSSPTARTLRP